MQNALKFKSSEAEDILTLKFTMLQRGLKAKGLAEKAKLHVRVVHNVLVGNNKTWTARSAINRCLRAKIFQKPVRKTRVPRKHLLA